MSKLNKQTPAGAANGKQVLIIAGITVLAALMIIAIFVLLSSRRAPDAGTDDFLKSIEAQRQGRQPGQETPAKAETSATYSGVLLEIKTDALMVAEKGTINKITINFDANTPITYNGEVFNRSRFYIGDQLEIIAKKIDNRLQAESIIVLVSASPATSKPAPPAVNVQPDGSIKSL